MLGRHPAPPAQCDHRTNDRDLALVHLEFVANAATYSVITALSYAGPSATITKAYAHLAGGRWTDVPSLPA